MEGPSNFGQALTTVREGFLLTAPRSFYWTTAERHYVDDVAVSERVFDLAYRGELVAARVAWLEEWEAAFAATRASA